MSPYPPGVNPNCDGTGPHNLLLQVRLMPIAGGGNLILCHTCWNRENHWRYRENQRLAEDSETQYDILPWREAEVYPIQ